MSKTIATIMRSVFNALLSSSFLLASTLSYATAFTVVPKDGSTLPTSVQAGNTVNAYYTVSNNTPSQRYANYVKYLPPNTLQVTSGGTFADTCGATFNLAPQGQSHDRCTLQLTVSGTVNSNDPDPQHHLFVCFPGGNVCTGTNSPLNVSVANLTSVTITPTSASIQPGGFTTQFRATGHFADGSSEDGTSSVTWLSSKSAIATIGSSGLATGITPGATNITAVWGNQISNIAALTVTPAYAYIANESGASVDVCSVDVTNGTLSGCAPTGSGFNHPAGLVMNLAGTYLYAGSDLSGTTTVIKCAVDASTGALTDCGGTGSGFDAPTGITFNASGTQAYVASEMNSLVFLCSVKSSDGTLSGCTSTGTGFDEPTSVALNPEGTLAYVTNFGNSTVSLCTVNSDGTLSGCAGTDSSFNFNDPTNITLNAFGNLAYVVSYGGNAVVLCAVDSNTGQLKNCADTGSGFATPLAIAINYAGNLAYVSNGTANQVSLCDVNSTTGALDGCNPLSPGVSFVYPWGIVLN